MRASSFIPAAALLCCLGSLQQVRAQSEAVQVQDVPKAVVDAIKAKYPDAEMRKAKKTVNNGTTLFGVGITSKTVEYDLALTPKGKFVEIEKTIPAAELPAKVSETIYAQYPNSTMKKTEKVTVFKEEKSFKVVVVTADKQTKKLVVNADGKITETK
jgi:hypothetical protein